MDSGTKCLIQAVAGSGKTQYLIEMLDKDISTVIIAYTINNQNDLRKRIIDKFNGKIPSNIHIFGFWQFVYYFCLAPFLGVKPMGISFDNPGFYNRNPQTKDGRFYSNKISKTLVENPTLYPYKERIDKYFSRVFIDEVQDLGGDDIDWLLSLIECRADVLAVGDYYQGTFQTSQRGNKNKKAKQDFQLYKNKFEHEGFEFDTTTLNKSYRCSIGTCNFIKDNLGIEMYPATEDSLVAAPRLINDEIEIGKIWHDNSITKLFYQERTKYSCEKSFNWGEAKGLTYSDICVILPESVLKLYNSRNLNELAPKTKSGFYVACTRASKNIFFISAKDVKKYKVV